MKYYGRSWSLQGKRGPYYALALVICLLLSSIPNRQARQNAAVQAASPAIQCNFTNKLLSTPPVEAHYLYSSTHGWFDTQHFGTGSPGQIIEDVREIASPTGSIISIDQGVREDITGYTGYYWVSDGIPEKDVVGVALSIYMDWSRRFEAWQGQLPNSLAGPLTSFSIEDLPSQYVGFFAVVVHMEPTQVLACYLDNTIIADGDPPHLSFGQETLDLDNVPQLQRLQNPHFVPLVETERGWRHVPWPESMRLIPIGSDSGYWRFVREETWFFGDE